MLFNPLKLVLTQPSMTTSARFVTQCVATVALLWSTSAVAIARDDRDDSEKKSVVASSAQIPYDYSAVLPVLKKYCADCHWENNAEGGVRFDSDEKSIVDRDVKFWLKVMRNVRADMMPPRSSEQPTADEKRQLLEWINVSAFQVNPTDPDPGVTPLRRLNRTEYRNTIRDLTGVDFNAEVVFPPDDTGFGFDNISDAMSLSPMLMEKCLQAAKSVVAEAVPTKTWVLPIRRKGGREFFSEDRNVNGGSINHDRPTVIRGTLKVEHAGEYRLLVRERLHGSFDYHPGQYQIECRLDAESLYESKYKWEENKEVRNEFMRTLQPGDHEVSITLKQLEDSEHEETDLGGRWVRYELAEVVLEGPLDGSQLEHPRGYSRFFPRDALPEGERERIDYAREIISRFAERAFRRPPNSQTLDRLVAISASVWEQPDATFESGIEKAFMAILASPQFLFRIEGTEPSDHGSESTSRYPLVDEYALASRMSYFLWSTMPDESLIALAKNGTLRSQQNEQIRRMLADPRSIEFVRSFAGQWLRARDVENVSIDPIAALGYQKEFEQLRTKLAGKFRRPRRGDPPLDPELEKSFARFRELGSMRDSFDADVRSAMRRETEKSFEYIVSNDRSLLELIDANYVFVNEKLAKLYGIEGVRGNDLQKVDLPPDSPRGGVLTQGTMLAVTSNPTRTSPVKRGLFILDNVVGTPAPPAPPNVPALEDSGNKFGGREPSLRELLAVHREAALCASCHSRMDPLGLALENFNAFGQWRDTEAGQPIDAQGELITGESFRDVRDLKRIIATTRKLDFYRCVTEKMLVYALGRGLEHYDEVTVDRIVEKLDRAEGRFSVLLEEVINSPAFQRRNVSRVVADGGN